MRRLDAMFKEVLQEVVENTDGGVAGLLMGYDGIPVDQYVKDGVFDIETIGMEYSVIVKSIRQAAEMLDVGAAREVAIKSERLTTVIRMLNDDYFIAITLKPSGNLGKARFLMRTRSMKLLAELV